jgi:hypothetical protein
MEAKTERNVLVVVLTLVVIACAVLAWRVQVQNTRLQRVETDLWTVYGLAGANLQAWGPVKSEIDSAYVWASRALKISVPPAPPWSGVRPPPPPCPPFCPPPDPLESLRRGATRLEAVRGSPATEQRP